MLSTEDVLSSWGFWYKSLGSHIKSDLKGFLSDVTPDGTTLCQIHVQLTLGLCLSVVWCNIWFLPSFLPDWHTLCVGSDWHKQSLTFMIIFEIYLWIPDLIFCQKYQSSRNSYSSLANPGSLMTVSLSCHQHGHATIAPTQSRPWHQGHLSTGNCRHQSAEAWSLYVLSACLDLRWFLPLRRLVVRGKKESWQLGTVHNLQVCSAIPC